jgi:NOL1/NOP2/fmu family ribosome biogenesis protein
MEYLPLSVPSNWGITETSAGYRFYPHLTQSEGFFCAVLRKKSMTDLSGYQKRKSNTEITKTEKAILEPFLEVKDELIIKKNNQYHIMNPAALDFLTSYEKNFYFKKAGVVIGEIKGTDMIPNHELAWYTGLNKQVTTTDLNKESALSYLRKQNFTTPTDVKGLNLITYKGRGIGWAKLLQNRINNYLPNELRILS